LLLWCTTATFADMPIRYQLAPGSDISPEQRHIFDMMSRSMTLAESRHMEEAAAVAEEAVTEARKTRFRDLQAHALLNMGLLELRRKRFDQAERLGRQAKLLFEADGNLVGQSNARTLQGEAAAKNGKQDVARSSLISARRIAKAAKDEMGALNASLALAQLPPSGESGRSESALDALFEAASKAGTPDAAGLDLRRAGRDAMRRGDLALAEKKFLAALMDARDSRSEESRAFSEIALGDLAAWRDLPLDANRHFVQAIVSARAANSMRAEAIALLRQAEQRLKRGEYAGALNDASDAKAAFLADNNKIGVAHALLEIGSASHRTNGFNAAEQSIKEALTLCAAEKNSICEARARLRLGTLDSHRGLASAPVDMKRALDLFVEGNDTLGMADALMEIGRMHGVLNDFNGAIEKFDQCRRIYLERKQASALTKVDYFLGLAAMMQDRLIDANAALAKAVASFRKAERLPELSSAEFEYGVVLGRLGDLRQARQRVQNALALARKLGQRGLEIDCLLGLSRIDVAMAAKGNAQASARAALTLANGFGDKVRIQRATEVLQAIGSTQ